MALPHRGSPQITNIIEAGILSHWVKWLKMLCNHFAQWPVILTCPVVVVKQLCRSLSRTPGRRPRPPVHGGAEKRTQVSHHTQEGEARTLSLPHQGEQLQEQWSSRGQIPCHFGGMDLKSGRNWKAQNAGICLHSHQIWSLFLQHMKISPPCVGGRENLLACQGKELQIQHPLCLQPSQLLPHWLSGEANEEDCKRWSYDHT